jgi:hypothetical protein
MFAVSDPNMIIAGFAAGGLVLAAFWRFIIWVREAPATPDPWDAEVERELSEPEAVEICPHCLTEQPPTAWFCQRCGRAIGPYNNLMPYVQIFSEGEVFRNGTGGRLRKSPMVLIGYVLISVGTYWLFAPIYLFSLFLNWNRSAGEPEPAEEQNAQP